MMFTSQPVSYISSNYFFYKGLDIDVGVQTAGDLDTWWPAFESLYQAALLPDGWDGEDAEPPELSHVNSAISLLNQLRHGGNPAPSRVVVSLDGEIVIEWQDGHVYQSLEIKGPGKGRAFVTDNDGPAQTFDYVWTQDTKQLPEVEVYSYVTPAARAA